MKKIFLTAFAVTFLSACMAGDIASKSSNSEDNDVNSDNVSVDNSNHHNNTGDSDADGNADDCSEAGFTNDGPGGFLWKPEGENSGNLALLFPENFGREFLAVCVAVAAAEEEEEDEERPEVLERHVAEEPEELEEECGTFAGYFEDGRQIWRFSKPGEAYTGTGRVDDRAQECPISIEGEPGERND